MFLRQYQNAIDLFINSYKKRHDILTWRLRGDNKTQEIPILSNKITIRDMNKQDYYIISTKDSTQNNVQLEEYQIYFMQESPMDTLNKMLDCVPNDIKDSSLIDKIKTNIEKIFRIDSTQKISYLLYNEYINTDNIQPQEIDIFYKVLMTVQQYDNNQNIFWNKNISENFEIDYTGSGTLKTNGLISKIIIKDYNGKLYKKIDSEGLTEIDLTINYPGYYQLELYEEEYLINILTFIQFNDLVKANIWTDKRNEQSYNLLINKYELNNIAYTDIDFTNEELKYFSQEIQKNPTYPLINRLQIIDNGNNEVSITIKDYNLLKALGNQFFIGVKEEDTLFTKYFDNYSIINNQIMTFNCNEYFLNGQMLFFVEDNKQNIINDLTRFSFDDDFTLYYHKIAEAELNIYSKRLLPLIDKRVPESKYFIQSSFQTILDKSDYYMDYWKDLIELVLIYGKEIDKNSTIKIILEDFINNSLYNTNFYDEPIVYYRSTNTIVFPPTKTANNNYVLIIHRLNKNENTIKTEYISSNIGAVDYSIKDKGQYIFYAIDANTYKFSGITYINNISKEECIYNYNLRMDVI